MTEINLSWQVLPSVPKSNGQSQQTPQKEMDKGGVLDVDTKRVSGLLAYDAGYIDKNLDIIVGFQTDEPLKRCKSFRRYSYGKTGLRGLRL